MFSEGLKDAIFSATPSSMEKVGWKPKDGGIMGKRGINHSVSPSMCFKQQTFVCLGLWFSCAVMSVRNFPVFEYLTWCIPTHFRLILSDMSVYAECSLRRGLYLLFEDGFTAGHRTQNKPHKNILRNTHWVKPKNIRADKYPHDNISKDSDQQSKAITDRGYEHTL